MKLSFHGRGPGTRASCSGQVLFKWVLFGFLVVVAAAGFALMMAHQQHQDELARVREESARELRLAADEVERLKAETAGSAPVAPATDNTELVKLRGEVADLRRQQQQWQRTIAENRQLHEAVRQWAQAAAEGTGPPANPVAVTPAGVNLVPTPGVDVGTLGDNDDPADVRSPNPGAGTPRPPKDPQAAACLANLQGIAGAKATWALEYHKQGTDVPPEGELFGLNKYLSQKPVCPSGGGYTMGAVGEKPRCSVPGHEN